MNLFKYINIPLFIISLAIGLFFVYVTMPDLRKIYVYPTPDNVDFIQYRDRSDACFDIKEKEVACPTKLEDMLHIPVQH
jgi:hypothetical protein